MDYNKIKTFVKVAELGSISSAAQTLRRSQSAISQQIQILENELELKLFERKNAKIYLSPDGDKVYESAKQHFSKIDEQILELKQSRQLVEGHIRLGAHHNYSTDFQVGQVIGEFCKQYPNVTFEITDGSSASIENDLIENKLDLGFIVVFKYPEMFVKKSVSKSEHGIYSSRDYLANTTPIKTVKDILDKKLIDLSEDFICLSSFLRKRSKTLIPTLKHRRPDVIVPNFEIAKHTILSGYGVGMLPNFMIEVEVKKGSIVQLFPSAKTFYAGLDIACRTNRTPRLCEELFVKYVYSKS